MENRFGIWVGDFHRNTATSKPINAPPALPGHHLRYWLTILRQKTKQKNNKHLYPVPVIAFVHIITNPFSRKQIAVYTDFA